MTQPEDGETSELEQIITAIVEVVNAETDLNAYEEMPNRLKFPAFLVEPAADGEPPISYLQAMGNSTQAEYHLTAWVLVGSGHPAEARRQLWRLLSPSGRLISTLNRQGAIGRDWSLAVLNARDYGDFEIGSKPTTVYGSPLTLHVE
jgi:hypothetical protein